MGGAGDFAVAAAADRFFSLCRKGCVVVEVRPVNYSSSPLRCDGGLLAAVVFPKAWNRDGSESV